MRNNSNPLSGGETRPANNWDGVKLVEYCGAVALATAASGALSAALPPNFTPIESALRCDTAGTLVTATRLGLGYAGEECKFGITGGMGAATAVTANAKHGPMRLDSPGVIFSNSAASAALSALAAETAFSFSATSGQSAPSIPAHTLRVGDVIRLRGKILIGSVNGTDTQQFKAYIGSVAVMIGPATASPANTWGFAFDTVVQIRAIGASGTCVATSAQPIEGIIKADGSGAVTYRMEHQASQALDTTAALTISVKATHSANSASNSCTLEQLVVEHLRPSSNRQQTATTPPSVFAVSDAGAPVGTYAGTVSAFLWGWSFSTLPNAA